MATDIERLADDSAQLLTLSQANADAINILVTKDTAEITDLQAQIVVLKALQPTLDLTGIETSIANLKATNAKVVTITTPPVTVDPVPVPPPPPGPAPVA